MILKFVMVILMYHLHQHSQVHFNELTVTNSFSVPTGDTDSRIHCQTAGSMRFNEDLGTLEFYTGDQWKTVNSFKDTGGRGRGLFQGGIRNSPILIH